MAGVFGRLVFCAACAVMLRPAAAMDIRATSLALTRATHAVLGVHMQALDDARTAALLGNERDGSGVLISADGLVLTTATLLLEADEIELSTDDELHIPARVIAVDDATGLGLVQALAPLHRAPVALGQAVKLDRNEPLVMISGGDDADVSTVRLLSRRAFAGAREFQIESALFTTPPRADVGGAGLFSLNGELVGIGLLRVNNALGVAAGYVPGNLFISTDLLKPVLDELRQHGRSRASRRAWMGLDCSDSDGELRIDGVAVDSPADVAGLRRGDRILRIDGVEVAQLGPLWKRLWYGGRAERKVVLQIERDGHMQTLNVQTVDRAKTLRHAEGI